MRSHECLQGHFVRIAKTKNKQTTKPDNKKEKEKKKEQHRHTLHVVILYIVGERGWGVEGKQVGSMDEEPQVRGCYNITFICTPTNQETVSVLEKTQANKTFRT